MSKTESNHKISPEEMEIIESLFKYPSLEKVFDGRDGGLAATKQKMSATIAELERVVRRGAKEDAAKAAKVVAAFQTALSFLDEIEAIRQT